MKNGVVIFFLCYIIYACSGNKPNSISTENEIASTASDTVRIANDELEYEIIIIEPGFNFWLASRAMPRNYYSQSYLEARNQFWVTEYNNRVLQPMRFDQNLYQMQIDYRSGIDYGYEVNYMLFNYLVYFQQTYKQQLGGFAARI
ncbi:MAG TPA: DUF6146 family protein [Flavobacterium sp.]|uniref:DUF6146 family protein n=1 Tax=unclassified Flavobacterium TaxID=196869 RepID=UPI000E9B9EB6|nr:MULTISPECIES: DUF6146 family protein [unclassified Flavobacterium]HBI00377.1 hypothetical protein [Flavobacterium sp.]HRE79004.1 DUF6146 family protein [Flavobacterium sp.]